MAAPIPKVVPMDTEQTADPQVKIVVVPPIFMLDEYCWDQISTHLSMTDVIMMEIADCRFRKAVLRKIAVLQQHVLNPRSLKHLSEYRDCDEFLGLWADKVTDLFVGSYGEFYVTKFESEWFKFLPHFKNLSRFVWYRGVLDSEKNLPLLPTGLSSLALVRCTVTSDLLTVWLTKLKSTLTHLEYLVYEPQMRAIRDQEIFCINYVWINCQAISELVNLKFLKLSGNAFARPDLLHISRLKQLEVLIVERVANCSDMTIYDDEDGVWEMYLFLELIRPLPILKTLKLDGWLERDNLVKVNEVLVSRNRSLELATLPLGDEDWASTENLKYSVYKKSLFKPQDPYYSAYTLYY